MVGNGIGVTRALDSLSVGNTIKLASVEICELLACSFLESSNEMMHTVEPAPAVLFNIEVRSGTS